MDRTPVNFTFMVSLAVQSTPTAKRMCLLHFLTSETPSHRTCIISSCLHFCCMKNAIIISFLHVLITIQKLAPEKGGVQINRVYKLLESPQYSQIALESMSLPIPIVLVHIWLRFVFHFHTSGLNWRALKYTEMPGECFLKTLLAFTLCRLSAALQTVAWPLSNCYHHPYSCY